MLDTEKVVGVRVEADTSPADKKLDDLKKDASKKEIQVGIGLSEKDIGKLLSSIDRIRNAFDKGFSFTNLKEGIDDVNKKLQSFIKKNKDNKVYIDVNPLGIEEMKKDISNMTRDIKSLNKEKIDIRSFDKFYNVLQKIESLLNSIKTGLNFETIRPSVQVQAEIEQITKNLENLHKAEKKLKNVEKGLNVTPKTLRKAFGGLFEFGDIEDVGESFDKYLGYLKQLAVLGGDLSKFKIGDYKINIDLDELRETSEYLQKFSDAEIEKMQISFDQRSVRTLQDVYNILLMIGEIDYKNLINDTGISAELAGQGAEVEKFTNQLHELNKELEVSLLRENRDLNVSLDTKSVEEFAEAIKQAVEAIGNLKINIPEDFHFEGLSAENLDKIIEKLGEIIIAVNNIGTVLSNGIDFSKINDEELETLTFEIKPNVDPITFTNEIEKQLKESGLNFVEVMVQPLVNSGLDFTNAIEEQLNVDNAIVKIKVKPEELIQDGEEDNLKNIKDKVTDIITEIDKKTQAFKKEEEQVELSSKTEVETLKTIEDKVVDISEKNNIELKLNSEEIHNQIDDIVNKINESIPDSKEIEIKIKQYKDTDILTDFEGNIIEVYRGVQEAIGGMISDKQDGITFFSDREDVAESYAKRLHDGKELPGKVYKTNLAMQNPLEIDAKGSTWKSIKYLGDESDESSEKIIELDQKIKNLRSELLKLYDFDNLGEGFVLDEFGTISGTIKENGEIIPAIFDSINDFEKATGKFSTLNMLDDSRIKAQQLLEELQDVCDQYYDISDAQDNMYGTHTTDEWAKIARDYGYDGIIIKNLYDAVGNTFEGENSLSTIFAVFDREQLKNLEVVKKQISDIGDLDEDIDATSMEEFAKSFKNIGDNILNDFLKEDDIKDAAIKWVKALSDSINLALDTTAPFDSLKQAADSVFTTTNELQSKMTNLISQSPIIIDIDINSISFDEDFENIRNKIEDLAKQDIIINIKGLFDETVFGMPFIESDDIDKKNADIQDLEYILKVVKELPDLFNKFHIQANQLFDNWSFIDDLDRFGFSISKLKEALKNTGFADDDFNPAFKIPSDGMIHDLGVVGQKYVLLGRSGNNYNELDFQDAKVKQQKINELADMGVNIARMVLLRAKESIENSNVSLYDPYSYFEVQEVKQGKNHRKVPNIVEGMSFEQMVEFLRDAKAILDKGLAFEIGGDNFLANEKEGLIPIDLALEDEDYWRMAKSLDELVAYLKNYFGSWDNDDFENRLDDALYKVEHEETVRKSVNQNNKNNVSEEIGNVGISINPIMDNFVKQIQANLDANNPALVNIEPKIDGNSFVNQVQNLIDEATKGAEFIDPFTGEVFTDRNKILQSYNFENFANLDSSAYGKEFRKLRRLVYDGMDEFTDFDELKNIKNQINSLFDDIPEFETFFPKIPDGVEPNTHLFDEYFENYLVSFRTEANDFGRTVGEHIYHLVKELNDEFDKFNSAESKAPKIKVEPYADTTELKLQIDSIVAESPIIIDVDINTISFDEEFEHIKKRIQELVNKEIIVNIKGLFDGVTFGVPFDGTNDKVQRERDVQDLDYILDSVRKYPQLFDDFEFVKEDLFEVKEFVKRFESLGISVDRLTDALKNTGFADENLKPTFVMPDSGAQHSLGVVGQNYVLLGRDNFQPATLGKTKFKQEKLDELADMGVNVARIVLAKASNDLSDYDDTKNFFEVQERKPGKNHREVHEAFSNMTKDQMVDLLRTMRAIFEKDLAVELYGDNLLFDESTGKTTPIDILTTDQYPWMNITDLDRFVDVLSERFEDDFDDYNIRGRLEEAQKIVENEDLSKIFNKNNQNSNTLGEVGLGISPLMDNFIRQIQLYIDGTTPVLVKIEPEIDENNFIEQIQNKLNNIFNLKEFADPETGGIFTTQDEFLEFYPNFKEWANLNAQEYENILEKIKEHLLDGFMFGNDDEKLRQVAAKQINDILKNTPELLNWIPEITDEIPDPDYFNNYWDTYLDSLIYSAHHSNKNTSGEFIYDIVNQLNQGFNELHNVDVPKIKIEPDIDSNNFVDKIKETLKDVSIDININPVENSFEKENQFVDNLVKSENFILSSLEQKVNEVTTAVDNKTRAFKEEEQVVSGTVQREITELEILVGQLLEIIQTIDKLKDCSEKIDFKFINEQNVNDKFVELISNLNDKLENLDIDKLLNLSSAIQNLKGTEQYADNLKLISDALLKFRESLSGISSDESDLLKSINTILSKGSALKNLVTILESTSEKFNEVKEVFGEKKEKKEISQEIEIEKNSKKWSEVKKAASGYKDVLGEIQKITYSMRQDKDGNELKSYKITGSKSSITLGENLDKVAEKETREYKKTASEINKIRTDFINAANKANISFDSNSLKVDNNGVITFTSTVEKAGEEAVTTKYKIEDLYETLEKGVRNNGQVALNKDGSLNKAFLNKHVSGSVSTKDLTGEYTDEEATSYLEGVIQAEEYIQRENKYKKERERLLEEGKKQEKAYYDSTRKEREDYIAFWDAYIDKLEQEEQLTERMSIDEKQKLGNQIGSGHEKSDIRLKKEADKQAKKIQLDNDREHNKKLENNWEKASKESYEKEIALRKQLNELKIKNLSASDSDKEWNDNIIKSLEKEIRQEQEKRAYENLNNEERHNNLLEIRKKLFRELAQAMHDYNSKLNKKTAYTLSDINDVKDSLTGITLGDSNAIYENSTFDTSGKGTITFIEELGDKVRTTTVYVKDLVDALFRISDGQFNHNGLELSSRDSKYGQDYIRFWENALQQQDQEAMMFDRTNLSESYAQADENVRRENEYLEERNRLLKEGQKQEKDYYDAQNKERENYIKFWEKELLKQDQDNLEYRKYDLSEAYAQADENVQRENEYLIERNRLLKEGQKQEKDYYNTQNKERENYINFWEKELSKRDQSRSRIGANTQINKTMNEFEQLRYIGHTDIFSQMFEEELIKVNALNIKLREGIITLTDYRSAVSAIKKNLKDNKNIFAFIEPEKLEQAKQEMKEYAMVLSDGKAELIETNTIGDKVKYSWIDQDNMIHNLVLSYNQLNGALSETHKQQKQVEKHTKTLSDLFKQGWQNVKQYVISFIGFYEIIDAVRYGINIIRELDTAFTEMRKVSDETTESLRKFQKQSFDIAGNIGTTAKQIQDSTADFLRLGYALEEASKLAEDANIYANVGDMEINEATEHMISSIKAWSSEFSNDTEASIAIVDKYNEIGNNFAITSADIGSAMERSAAALKAGGNTLNEALGLITAGNLIQQDADTTANALKVVSLRIRGSKTELEEMGEETDGLADSTSKLREEIMALSGVDIMKDNNTYKSTAEIIKELGKVFENMTDVSQASLLEKIAGKTRASTVAGLLENYKIIDEVIQSAENADGSAMEENLRYMDSIEGKIAQFTNELQEFWYNLIDSETIKMFIDFGTTALDIIGKIADALGEVGTIIAGVGIAANIKYKDTIFSMFENLPNLLSGAKSGSDKPKIFYNVPLYKVA